MHRLIKIALLVMACVAPIEKSFGQACESVKDAPTEKIKEYLQHVSDDASDVACVQLAFHRIATLPPERAIPLLISYLAYKRPLNEGERRGLFLHGNGPNVLYPAVHELYLLGASAEPALLGLIAGNEIYGGPERKNALYTLLLIDHGNVVSLIEMLHRRSVASESPEGRNRLQSAARDALKWCDERSRTACENALK